jgi:cytoskeletal protein CcmA (bactofilin family)
MRRIVALTFVALAVLAIAAPSFAQEEMSSEGDTPKDLVVLTGGARIAEDQSFDDAVIFDGVVSVQGHVGGDLVVFHGDVDIKGAVDGDVVVFSGDVTVRSGAVIGGDLASTREPVIEEGATVQGETRKPSKDFFRPVEVLAARAALWITATVSLLFLGLLLLGLAPRPMDRVAATWQASKGSAALWGIVVLIGLPVGAVLAMVTIFGIPFGVGLLLALGLLYSTGYVAGAWALGRSLVPAPRSRALSFLAGFAIVRLLGLIPIVGGIVSMVVLVAGLGLLAVAIWRARGEERTAAAPA